MVQGRPINEESSAVQSHLNIMQGVINRMAENSRSCKVWCVTLVAATLVLVAPDGGAATCPDCLGSDAAVPVPGLLLFGVGAIVYQVSERIRRQAAPGRIGVCRHLPGNPVGHGAALGCTVSAEFGVDMALLPIGHSNCTAYLVADNPF